MTYDVINRSRLEAEIINSMNSNFHKDAKAGIHHKAEHLHFLYILFQMPTEEKRIGHWEVAPNQTLPCKTFICSECRNEIETKYFANECYYNYCPHCGSMNGHRDIKPYKEIDIGCYNDETLEKAIKLTEEVYSMLGINKTEDFYEMLQKSLSRLANKNSTLSSTRNLTDEEAEIYEKWLGAESIDTGINLFDDRES